MSHPKVVIIGGGIVGLATGRALAQTGQCEVTVLEAEEQVARHQSGRNSGVIHSGLYYKPGSLKAKNCAAGRDAMYTYCQIKGIRHERCGKLVVATHEKQITALNELERRGTENGLSGLERLDVDALLEREPAVTGVAGLWVPETGIVDFSEVAKAMAEDIFELRGRVVTLCRVAKVAVRADAVSVMAEKDSFRADVIVNCAGLQCDRVARMCGEEPDVRIIPFRGEYYVLKKDRETLVRNLIYPVPDPRFPFLGVHFTRMARGGVEAGPNAVLALKREGYEKTSFDIRDLLACMRWPGFWKMAKQHWRTGMGEVHRSWSKAAFVHALQALIPEIEENDLMPGGAGVRAQAVTREGKLVDDFRLVNSKRAVHVLNAPSPAATSSLSIGDTVSKMVLEKLT